MEYASSMYLFDQTDEELIQFSSLPYQDYNTDQQDNKLLCISYPDGTDDSPATKQDSSGRRRKASTAFLDDTDERNPNENKKKKVMHRDIERQRRQEMATLYTSLRSQLPLEHLKGKRSISDHMHEAVNYIKHLKKKMEELKDKKDGLTRLLSVNSNNPLIKVDLHCSTPSISPRDDDVCLTVKPCLLGVEVVISTDHLTRRQGLQLSKVLEILVGEGLNVVNCISTKVNDSLLHTIESEVNDGRNINLSDLQQKLLNLTIRSPS